MVRLVFGLLAALVCHVVWAADAAAPAKRPHIVYILADDLGWNDVGYHGSEIKTPTIDRLAAAGARLEQFYVQPVCTPTRAALLTGRYPMRHGLQVGVIRPNFKYGMPLEERTLPAALKEAGYSTAITGKWHLGHFDPRYVPTRRGFDRQYGHYNGAIDYYTHLRDGNPDWYRDDKPLKEEGYSTNLIAAEATKIIAEHDPAKPLFLFVTFNATHAPLQAPAEYLDRYKTIAAPARRKKAAMTACLDDAIGRIVAALGKRGLTDDTLLIFSSDNGGPLGAGSNNDPLRGGKTTLYEGGVRACAFAVWPGKIKPGTVVREPLHVADWYPTLLTLAGASLKQKLPLDGRDLWPTIAEGKPTPHEEILHNVEPNRGAIRRGKWKLVVHGPLPATSEKKLPSVELFNIDGDPNEKTNVAEKQPEVVRDLLARLNGYAREAVPPKAPRERQGKQ